MGADITSYVEVRRDGQWQYVPMEGPRTAEGSGPFGWRNYGVFGFLADVRNYSHSPVIAEPRGLPDDVTPAISAEYYEGDGYAASWLTAAELLTYDYDQVFWDRRVSKVVSRTPQGGSHIDGAALADEGEGRHLTLREFLGEGMFFEALEKLAALGDPQDTRVVFWFDS